MGIGVCAGSSMMGGHVSAVRLRARHGCVLLAAVGRQARSLERRGDPAATSSARRTPAAAGAEAEIDLGGPGADRCAGRSDPHSATGGLAAAGHPGHGDPLAPGPATPPVGRQVPSWPFRSARYSARHPPSGPSPGRGECCLGIQENPWRACGTWRPDRALDGMGGPYQGRG